MQEVHAFINRRVRKDFAEHGVFNGIITAVNAKDDGSGEDHYQITYEDGDREDVEFDELEDIILPLLPDKEETSLVKKSNTT